MKILEIERPSVDLAIADGLSQMDLSLEDVIIDVLEEGSKGLFGLFGAKQAKVRLTRRDSVQEESAPPKPQAPKAQPQAPAPPKPQQPVAAPVAKKPEAPSAPKTFVQEDKPVQETPVEPGESAAFLAETAKLMGVDVTVETKMAGSTLRMDIQGDEKGILIGHRGETLDALQYLVSLVHNKDNNDFQRIQLDSQNYRKKREETLVRLANRLADKARRSNRRMTLEPMNPYERRILHSALQNNPYVTTHSEGDEPNRRVVILPADKSQG